MRVKSKEQWLPPNPDAFFVVLIETECVRLDTRAACPQRRHNEDTTCLASLRAPTALFLRLLDPDEKLADASAAVMTGRRAVEAVDAAATGLTIHAMPETLILRTTASGTNIPRGETEAGKRTRGVEAMDVRIRNRDQHLDASQRGILFMPALHEGTTTEETFIRLTPVTSPLLGEGTTGNPRHAGTYTIVDQVRLYAAALHLWLRSFYRLSTPHP